MFDYPEAGLGCHLDDGSSVVLESNVVELSTLCSDVLRCPQKVCGSLKAVFEKCHPNK